MAYELISDTRPKAKKAHKCAWCGEEIPVGEIHRHEVSKYCGDFQNHRWHLECDEAAKKSFDESFDEEFELYGNERPNRNPS